MVLIIDQKTINLDETELANLVSDLSELANLIEQVLRKCQEELDQDSAQTLLSKVNLIADVYC